MMSSDSEIPVFHLTKEMKEQFTKTRDLLDSILETFDVLEDEELLKRIKTGEKEIEDGETVSLDQLIEDLNHD